MKTTFHTLRQRSLLRVFGLAFVYMIFCGQPMIASEQRPESTDAIRLNGIFTMGNDSMFSLYDVESGQSYWLQEGQAWGELRVIEYIRSQGLLKVSWFGRQLELEIQRASTEPLEVIYSQLQIPELSSFNQQLMHDYKKLIKETHSPASGRILKNHQAQGQLRRFISTNPSPTDVNDFLFSELKDYVDMEEFLHLEFPKRVPSRSSRDTPGWDIKDGVTHEDILQILASNPTTQHIEAIKKVRE